jgi:hypothetical protein
MHKWWLAGVSLPAVAGLVWIAISSVAGGKAPSRALAPQAALEAAESPPVPAPRALDASPKPVSSAPPPKPPANAVEPVSQPDPAQMKALRDLLDTNPDAALAEARKDLARDPRGPDAAERTWVVVRALTRLGRSEEAHREAEAMVQSFRGTQWASDVERHVLAHP